MKGEPVSFYLWVNSLRMQKEILQIYSYVYAILNLNIFSFIHESEIYTKYTPNIKSIYDKSRNSEIGHIRLYICPIISKRIHPDWQTFVRFIRSSTPQYYRQKQFYRKIHYCFEEIAYLQNILTRNTIILGMRKSMSNKFPKRSKKHLYILR